MRGWKKIRVAFRYVFRKINRFCIGGTSLETSFEHYQPITSEMLAKDAITKEKLVSYLQNHGLEAEKKNI